MKKLLPITLLSFALVFIIACNKDETAVTDADTTTTTTDDDHSDHDHDDDDHDDDNSSSTYNGSGSLSITTSATGMRNRSSAELTPDAFKLALTNFWLSDTAGNMVNVINPDSTNPIYTPENPLIMSFTDGDAVNKLLSNIDIPAGKYDGYRMEFLYMEMDLATAFHTKWPEHETDYPDAADILDTVLTRSFKLYYNPIASFCRRDFIVELDTGSNEWFWMRRAIEDQDNYRNFFIKVDTTSNNHPPGGAGPESIIDLFANEEFWGKEVDYCDKNSKPIFVDTKDPVSEHDIKMDGVVDIPDNTEVTINIEIDIYGVMMFNEETSTISGVDFHDGVLDLGPGYDQTQYGDQGLHPRMPIISVK